MESKSIQLYGVDSLCFDKEDFMKENFNVDTFVQIHHSSGCGGLETLRDDLGVYLKILRSAMIDLINRDYADFVNLSTNLTGLDRLIEALKTPLGQLREEVMSVEEMLRTAIDSVSSDVERRHSINRQKALLHRLNQISIRLDRLESLLKSRRNSSSDPKKKRAQLDKASDEGSNVDELVDRIAAEINHLNFLVSHCEGASLLNTFRPRVDAVINFVEMGLERGLREGIQGGDKELLMRTLRNYASLGTINHAHQHVQDLIRNILEDIISEQSLKSDPRGLRGMYEKTLSAIKKVCDPLLRVTQESGFEDLSGYAFLENSAWPEIVYSMENRTPQLFNPGNPSAFHERCKESMIFLDSFEKLLIYEHKIEAFRNLSDYSKFLELWNLPVYFQIRYQEIGQVLESSLNECEDLSCILLGGEDKSPYLLKSTLMTWQALLKCWDAEIFLPPLIHRFWKLTLLILSRYRTWFSTMTDTLKVKCKNEGAFLKSVSSSPDLASASHVDSLAGTKSVQDFSQLIAKDASNSSETLKKEGIGAMRICISLLHDVAALSSSISASLYPVVISPWIVHLPPDKQDIFKETLEHQVEKQEFPKQKLIDAILESLTSAATMPLKQVTDTPRLFRRTNRALPTSPQPYVSNSVASLQKFATEGQDKISSSMVQDIICRVFTSVIQQYHKLIFDVLSSVYKMEESLKRLKRARDRGSHTGGDSSGMPSDDDKIRAQIQVDVMSFGDHIKSFGIEMDSVEGILPLLKMANEAKDGKFVP